MDSRLSFKCHSQSQADTMGKEIEEKKAKTMNVELALQRELAYRRKIEELQLQPYVDSGDESLPVQVQFPSQCTSRLNLISNPRLSGREQLASLSDHECLSSQNPFSRPNSCSGPMTCEPKQPASSSKSPPQRLQPLMDCNLNNPSLDFFCELCQVPCSGSLNYKQHLNGKGHKAKLQALKFDRKDGDDTCGMANLKSWCHLCKIWCMDDNLLKQHLAGQKHKKMQERLKEATAVEGEIVEEQFRCGLCGLECSSKELLQSHFNGKKHQAELRKQEYSPKVAQEAQNQPKRCKLCNTWCADKSSLQMHIREKKHFLGELELKKREWIRDINILGMN